MVTDVILEIMEEMGYRLANLSEREFTLGPDRFFRKTEKLGFPFISANLVWEDSGKPVMAPYQVFEVPLPPREGRSDRPLRVGILGINRYAPDFRKVDENGRNVVTLEPELAIPPILAEFRAQGIDLVVALAHMTLQEARSLVGEVKGIDLVIGGRGPGVTPPMDRNGQTWIAGTRISLVGNQGKRMGELRLFFDDDFQLLRVERQLVYLTLNYPVDQSVETRVQVARKAVNDMQRSLAAAAPAGSGGARGGAASAFVGSAACGDCHPEALDIWASSSHAQAFEILRDLNQSFNPRCIGCHTTGQGLPGGFRNATLTSDRIHVQCEACHGPGGNHASDPQPGYGGESGEGCLQCHNTENSPDFHRKTYWKKIAH